MFFLACTNDVSYLHSWGSIVAQDVVMPFRNRPLSPKGHMLLLRLCITGVTIFGFCWSLFYHQVGYIRMYFAVTGAIFLGGAGSVIIGGLYWKKGTTAAAWTALTAGGVIAVSGIYLDHYWVDLYPHLANCFPRSAYLARHGDKFPINGQYVNGISMAASIGLYILISLLTSRKDFNLSRMLHRGQYAIDALGNAAPAPDAPPRTWRALLGIDEHFTRSDKAISITLFCYTMAWFGVFVFVTIWNLIHVWPDQWWSNYWFYASIVLPIVLGSITSVWFTIGGLSDLRVLFKRLAVLQRDANDDGTVIRGDVHTPISGLAPEALAEAEAGS
jgi:SSS family solute:Na+ symporter